MPKRKVDDSDEEGSNKFSKQENSDDENYGEEEDSDSDEEKYEILKETDIEG